MKRNNNKNTSSYFLQSFFLQIITRTTFWLVYLFVFFLGGKKTVNTDILGKIYEFCFGKKRSFSQYFVGASNEEKAKIVNYAIYFIGAIIFLNFVSLIINRYLWKKDRYIENNKYYLHNNWIFIINSLTHVSCAFLLTFSFASAYTFISTMLFISLNTWGGRILNKRVKKEPDAEEFFVWKNEYVRKITFYSALIVFIAPFIFGRFNDFLDSAMTKSPEGLAKTLRELIDSNANIKSIIELIKGTNFNFLHWFILIWFIKNILVKRNNKLDDFWTQVNAIDKKVVNYRHYYYYQESWSVANNTLVNLGDYSYLKNSPNFLSKKYLESDLNIEKFAQQNKKVVKYIEFCENKIKEKSKKNFLYYSLFNDFESWDDCVRTENLIKKAIKN